MEINELEYNAVELKHAEGPTGKGTYKNILPITLSDYDVRFQRKRDGDINVTVWDGRKGVADMWLEPRKFAGLQVYQVKWVGNDVKYKGQGVGYQLYIGLISILGLNIVQTTSHSVGARRMWLKLAQEPKIQAYGFDAPNGVVFHVTSNKTQTELQSTKRGIKLYNNDNTGMILVKTNSKADKLFTALQHVSEIKQKGKEPNVFGVKDFKPLAKGGRSGLE
jgi:hypothetical protein